MTPFDDCPNLDQLVRYLDEKTSAVEEAQLTRHVDDCDRCQRLLEKQTTENEIQKLVSDFQEQQPDSHFLTDTLRKAANFRKKGNPKESAFTLVQSNFDGIATGLQLDGPIGQGGMGVVMKALDLSLNRKVAIKFLSPQFAGDHSAHKRFVREARLAAGINHPNIVTIHSVEDVSPYPYFTMEYIDGVPLSKWVEDESAIDFERVMEKGRQLASGLAAAHEQNIVHRDIKPDNVLIDARSDQAKLTDFGLACVLDDTRLTQSGVFLGSPGFQAPEALHSSIELDPRSDVFSLGCVLYFMCTRQPPFPADNLITALQRAAKGEFIPVKVLAPDIPENLAHVIQCSLLPDPKKRMQTMNQVLKHLHDPSTNSLIRTPPPPIQPSPPAAIRIQTAESKNVFQSIRGRYWLAAGASAMLLLITIVAILTWNPKQTSEADQLTGTDSQQQDDRTLRTPSNQGRFQGKKNDGNSPNTSRMRSEDQEFPFLVNSIGSDVRQFRNLRDAISAASDQSTIIIHSNARMVFHQPFVTSRKLSLVAAKGMRPTIEFVPDSSETSGDDDFAFWRIENTLHLTGIDFHLTVTEDAEAVLFSVDSTRFIADDCRFFMSGESTIISSESFDSLEFTDCQFFAASGCGIEIAAEKPGNLSMRNCLLVTKDALRLESDQEVSIRLKRCTAFTRRFAEITGEWESLESPLFNFIADQSVISSDKGVLAFDVGDENLTREICQSLASWTGKRNILVSACVVHVDSDTIQPDWCNDFSEWKNLFSESDSQADPNPFKTELDRLSYKLAEEEVTTASDFELRKDLPDDIGYSLQTSGHPE